MALYAKKLGFTERSTAPATPATGNVEMYVLDDGKAYLKDDAGTETQIAMGGIEDVYNLDSNPADLEIIAGAYNGLVYALKNAGILAWLGCELVGEVQDALEAPLGGVTVNVYNDDSLTNLIATTETSLYQAGLYMFLDQLSNAIDFSDTENGSGAVYLRFSKAGYVTQEYLYNPVYLIDGDTVWKEHVVTMVADP